MAGTKISALPAVTGLVGGEQLPLNQGGTTKRYTVSTPVQFQPANPTGRTGASVMMGLGTTCVYTPSSTGRLFVMFSGDASNSILGDGMTVQGYWGTGGAPANAAAVTGTSFSKAKTAILESAGNEAMTWALQGVITGRALGTALWFDCSLANAFGGLATIANIDFTCFEI